jgi:large subunit ribosomal protein L25
MSEVKIKVKIRTEIGKKAKTLRRKGEVPGIYYAHGEENIPISIPELVLQPLYKTTHTNIISLELSDGSTKLCILRDVQFDPLTDRPVHCDLFGLKENEPLTINIPVVVRGTPKGVRDGGILQQVLHRVKISCLPKNIPDHIEVDVEPLLINQAIHIKQLNVPNVTFLDNENNSVVAVLPPVVQKEAVPAVTEGEAVAEPEVIAKGKKVEEGEEETK